METPRHVPIEETEVFRRYVTIADWAWRTVQRWPPFAKDTLGKQLVRAIDGVGATLVEGDGRHGDKEALYFFRVARGSARETRYWLLRATERGLIPADEGEARIAELTSATQLLNRLIAYRRRSLENDRVCEDLPTYDAAAPDPISDEP